MVSCSVVARQFFTCLNLPKSIVLKPQPEDSDPSIGLAGVVDITEWVGLVREVNRSAVR